MATPFGSVLTVEHCIPGTGHLCNYTDAWKRRCTSIRDQRYAEHCYKADCCPKIYELLLLAWHVTIADVRTRGEEGKEKLQYIRQALIDVATLLRQGRRRHMKGEGE